MLHNHPAGGLATAVVSPGGLEFFQGAGVADRTRGTPITEDTVFRVGSISKTFTAIAIMQLRDRGLIDLDDAASRHLRAFRLTPARSSFAPVTIRQLLTHTGGIGELRNVTDVIRPTIGLATPADRPSPSLAAYYRGRLRVEVEPGTKWAYANHGFSVLGQLVEDVSGEPFGSYMRRHVFGPLGLETTDFVRTDAIAGQLATGYTLRRHGLKEVKDRDIVVQAAVSVFATTADMARYAAALLGGGRLPLKPESLSEMFQPQYQPDPRLPGLGLAFWRNEVGSHRTVGHGGGWPGFISAMVLAPDDGVAVLSFTNSGTVTPNRVSRRAAARPARRPRRRAPAGRAGTTRGVGRAVRLVRPGAGHPHQRAAADAHRRRRGSADPRQAPDVARVHPDAAAAPGTPAARRRSGRPVPVPARPHR